MKMHKLAVAIAAMTMSLAANAGTVDLFTTSQGGDQVTTFTYIDATPTAGDTGVTITSGVGGSVTTGGTDILGGNRDMFISLLNNGGISGRKVEMGVNGGVMDFSTSTLTRGRGQIQWDGATNTDATIDYVGLGGYDLTAGGTLTDFALDIIFADAGFNFDITAYTDATHWTRVSLVSNEHLSPVTTLIPFSAFTSPFLCGAVNPVPGVLSITCAAGNLTADLSNLGALVADIDRLGGSMAIDLTLDAARTVPEPGVLGLLGIGLLGFAAVARRQKKQA